MLDGVNKDSAKCEVPGCKSEASWCYHGSSSHELCDKHDHGLEAFCPCLAAWDDSREANDRAEATLTAVGAGSSTIEDYVAARKEERAKDEYLSKHIQSWIKDQGRSRD